VRARAQAGKGAEGFGNGSLADDTTNRRSLFERTLVPGVPYRLSLGLTLSTQSLTAFRLVVFLARTLQPRHMTSINFLCDPFIGVGAPQFRTYDPFYCHLEIEWYVPSNAH
jgi:hypothetical protein